MNKLLLGILTSLAEDPEVKAELEKFLDSVGTKIADKAGEVMTAELPKIEARIEAELPKIETLILSKIPFISDSAAKATADAATNAVNTGLSAIEGIIKGLGGIVGIHL